MESSPYPLGTIVTATRHYVHVLTENGELVRGKVASKARSAAVGDHVHYELQSHGVFVHAVEPPKNVLVRSYYSKTKKIAANVDRLLIITAVEPLWNSVFIDRAYAIAYEQEIPCTLVINKTDLGVEESQEQIAIYQALGVPMIHTSAKSGDGMAEVKKLFEDPALKQVVLCGVSGVGKSTLLNALIPEAQRTTNEVSPRTGQGRQTTSQARGYHLRRKPQCDTDLLLIDLPGIQKMGVAHLSSTDVKESFQEFTEVAHNCEFTDCSHMAEPNCGVKEAVEAGTIAASRYLSYIGMLEEIEAARPY